MKGIRHCSHRLDFSTWAFFWRAVTWVPMCSCSFTHLQACCAENLAKCCEAIEFSHCANLYSFEAAILWKAINFMRKPSSSPNIQTKKQLSRMSSTCHYQWRLNPTCRALTNTVEVSCERQALADCNSTSLRRVQVNETLLWPEDMLVRLITSQFKLTGATGPFSEEDFGLNQSKS